MEPPSTLSLANRSHATVRAIEAKPCRAADSAFAALPGSALAPGCRDLVARDDRGRAVGVQRGLEVPPDAVGTLR